MVDTVAGSRIVGSVRIGIVRSCQWRRLSGSVRTVIVCGCQWWRLCGRYDLLLLVLLVIKSYLQTH